MMPNFRIQGRRSNVKPDVKPVKEGDKAPEDHSISVSQQYTTNSITVGANDVIDLKGGRSIMRTNGDIALPI